MEITWLGHSSFKIKARGRIIYIDPYKGDYTEKADIVLVTHAHYDHFSNEKMNEAVSDHTHIFGPAKAASERHGVTAIMHNETKEAEGIKIHCVHAYNINKAFHPKGEGNGYVIEAEGKKLYHAGDTDRIPEMKELASLNIDIALLPVSGTYVMNPKEAVEAVKDIVCKTAIPMHYGSVVGTTDDAEVFKELAERETDAKAIVMKEGQTIEA